MRKASVWFLVFSTLILCVSVPAEGFRTKHRNLSNGESSNIQREGQGRPTLKNRDLSGSSERDFDSSMAQLSNQISTEMTENRKRTIAVVEFVDLKGKITDMGRFVSEELITRLYQTQRFRVIERQMLNKVISEQKLILTGTFDQGSVQRLGRLLGVDAICTGTVTELARSVKVNARLISTETAEIFAVASTEIYKDESITKLLGGGSGSENTSEQPESKPITRRAQSNFFTFELQECRISGTTIICDFLITNNDKDRKLNLRDDTKMYDELGNGYKAFNVAFGNAESELCLFCSGVYGLLVSGVTTQGRVEFREVSPRAKKITLLQLECASRSGDFNIQFRNIPLIR